ncbi:MAG: NUDIX domain-containing protein [Hamadaea sp.]|uniref:NUDIX hydrolase n=1 Tax=Hamadaea sp. TaxID=2024425 RepID=UPI001818B270|nr:NUDIX domain-containing protein [Hamadaea sp.]NUR70109.1 NUDIX domain-containing protein [Hamadaea sp.]NUT21439.1 NUDIX domain-containing protein [Hamadaea sp.]
MPMSPYVRRLRGLVGHDVLLLPSVSAVVVNDAGEILFGQRSDSGQWSLPAGAVDPGEQPADAIVREVFEETGVEIVVERLAGVAMHPVVYPNGDQCEYLNVWFRCRAVGGEARVNDDESLDVAWFRPDDLPAVESWIRLRIDVALKDEPAWYAKQGESHEELSLPHAL